MRQFCALISRRDALEEAADRRAAIIAVQITNMAGRYIDQPVSLDDFMPRRTQKKQTPEDMQLILLAINSALGGEVVILDG